jgi:NAD(P)-dependent dehydrogenase (short-subunit alcohol dehydrogenase family)
VTNPSTARARRELDAGCLLQSRGNVRGMDAPVVVVTGGNRGIGREICRQLASRGAQVILTARDATAGAEAAAALAVRFHPLEVTTEASAATLVAFLAQEFGRCDVLVNNAGIIAGHDDSILTVSPAAVEATLATNTVGPLRLAQMLLPLLRKSARARIVNVSSGAGELTDFDGGWSPAYSLSKASLNLITRMLAAALANDGVAVNAICPGWVRTDMGGAGAPRSVTEGADTAVWLALDTSQDLTGKFVRDRKVIPW